MDMKSHVENKNLGLVIFLVAILIASVSICCAISINKNVNSNALNAQTEFSIVDSLPNGNGKKVNVILLNGQSNASGVSNFSYLRSTLDANEISTYENGFPNVYINYFCENGNNSSNGKFENVKIGQGCTPEHFGPELGLAKKLNELAPNETFIILKYSWGGSNLYEQWRAPSSLGRTGEIYTAFINFTIANMQYLRSKNYDAQIIAMCWMQGESDSFDVNIAKTYADNLEDLIADARRDLSPYVQNDGMYFIDAGISDSPLWTHYKIINNCKREVSAKSSKNIYLDTISSGLSYLKEPFGAPDHAHYDSESELLLGELYGEKILLISQTH